MSSTKEILEQFFKEDGGGLVQGIAGLPAEQQNAIMTIKVSFESERQKKGGCTGCRLRRLMKKYRPQVEAVLNG
jgi:hypothetical protein